MLKKAKRQSSWAGADLNAKRIGIKSRSELRDHWLHKDLGKIGNDRKLIIPNMELLY